jgi:hypothetical protein
MGHVRNSNREGTYVRDRCESVGLASFTWSICRRSTPLGMKLTESGSASFHAAGSSVLDELVENILKEEEVSRSRLSTAPCTG